MEGERTKKAASRKETEKKSSSSSKHDKHSKKDKKDKKKRHSEKEPEPQKKKRKASVAQVGNGDKQVPDLHPLKKVCGWLTMLSIPFDESRLSKVKRHQEKRYLELVEVMSGLKTKGLIYAYSVRTPLGRLFWYSQPEREFKNVREEHNFIKLTGYTKEAELKMIDIQNGLSDNQRKAALDHLGLTGSDIVLPETWLFALIEIGVIPREEEKPLSTQSTDAVLFHDTVKKQTYWLSSELGKARFRQVIVTHTRTITENNILNEIGSLSRKRKEIVQFLDDLNCTASTIHTMSDGSKRQRNSKIASSKPSRTEKKKKELKKKKLSSESEEEDVASAKMEVEKPAKPSSKSKSRAEPRTKKQKQEATELLMQQSPLLAMRSSLSALLESSNSSSGSYSSASSSSSSDEESIEPPRKSKVSSSSKRPQDASSIAKSLQVKRDIEGSLKLKQVIEDALDPEIRAWRTLAK